MAKYQIPTGTEVGQGRREHPKSTLNPGHSGTDPNKVKQEIQRDVNAGIGAMTSREAGSMRD